MEGLAECCVLLMQKAKAQGLSLIKQTVFDKRARHGFLHLMERGN